MTGVPLLEDEDVIILNEEQSFIIIDRTISNLLMLWVFKSFTA